MINLSFSSPSSFLSNLSLNLAALVCLCHYSMWSFWPGPQPPILNLYYPVLNRKHCEQFPKSLFFPFLLQELRIEGV